MIYWKYVPNPNLQNNNERFNSCIEALTLKPLYCEANTIETAAFLPTCTSNNGYLPFLKIINVSEIVVDPQNRIQFDAVMFRRNSFWGNVFVRTSRNKKFFISTVAFEV